VYAVKTLEDKGFVCRGADRLVHLSNEGNIQRELHLNKSAIIRRFLRDVLHLDRTAANADACAMENVISLDTLCALCRFTINARKIVV
jgi:DtxR family Mn-dependent transcriptional regulator